MSDETKNPVDVIPLRGNVLVKIIAEGKSEGGIDLPDGVRLKNRCQVVAVGRGHLTENGVVIPCEVKPGDFVIAATNGAPVVERLPEGDYCFIPESSIIAIDRRPPSTVPVLATNSAKVTQLPKGQRRRMVQ